MVHATSIMPVGHTGKSHHNVMAFGEMLVLQCTILVIS